MPKMTCEFCHEKFRTPRGLSNHIWKKHKNDYENSLKLGIIKIPILLEPDRAKVESIIFEVPAITWKNKDFEKSKEYIEFCNQAITDTYAIWQYIISETSDIELVKMAKHITYNVYQELDDKEKVLERLTRNSL